MITQQHTEEGLSIAYIQAVSAYAGINLNIGRQYDYGVDGTFHEVAVIGGKIKEAGYSLDFQLKASVNCRVQETAIHYDLDVGTNNYLAMRSGRGTPIILIVLMLPQKRDEWLSLSPTELFLRHSCYWVSSASLNSSDNTSTQVVYLPKENLFDSQGLLNLIESVKSGEIK